MPRIDPVQAQKPEEKYDPEMPMRPLVAPATWVVGVLLFLLSWFQCETAGFGLLREAIHRGIHPAFVRGMIFLVIQQQ